MNHETNTQMIEVPEAFKIAPEDVAELAGSLATSGQVKIEVSQEASQQDGPVSVQVR